MVKLARHVFTGEKVAVKVIDKTKLDEVSRAHLFQEVRCMKLVQHPNVVRLYEVIDTQTKLYLILELGDGGDLYDYIMRHENGLDQECARHYFRQVRHHDLLLLPERVENERERERGGSGFVFQGNSILWQGKCTLTSLRVKAISWAHKCYHEMDGGGKSKSGGGKTKLR